MLGREGTDRVQGNVFAIDIEVTCQKHLKIVRGGTVV